MSEPPQFRVPGFSIPYSGQCLTDTLRLNQFQSRVRDLLEKDRDILLTAPTGGGKTLTLLLNPRESMRGASGFAALYPNNTLLLNQLCTVEEVITNHFGAVLVDSLGVCNGGGICETASKGWVRCECARRNPERECIEPLTVYRVDEGRVGNAWLGASHIALLALSGRYVVSNGLPKRDVVEAIARKVLNYRNRGGIYTIVFSTPDTYLLLATGAYRDFEDVGKTLHNLLLSLAEGKDPEAALRTTGVLTRSSVSSIVGTIHRLLSLPLFIDEFHVYGPYEVDALYAILKLYKHWFGKPVVFSSATPARDVLEELDEESLSIAEVKAQTVSGGNGFQVRGDTLFTLLGVPTRRKGLSSYFEAAESVPGIVLDTLSDKLGRLEGGRALIVLERLWMVAELARNLSDKGLNVECIASIVPRDACTPGSPVILGSEATTQGVNLGRVVLGITSGTSSEDVVQRIGRVGRRGVDSEVYLVLPQHKLETASLKPTMSYWELVDAIRKLYPDYPKRSRDTTRLISEKFHELRRRLIYALGVASHARVSGMGQLYKKLNLTKEEALNLLDSLVGPPETYTSLIVFRKTGFTVKYIIVDTGEKGEASIGTIARNFQITSKTGDSTLVIRLNKSRSPVKARVLRSPAPLSGKLVSLRKFLKLAEGRLNIGEAIELDYKNAGDTLVYVVDAGQDLSEYLSYTGEGAEILSAKGRRYALVFV